MLSREPEKIRAAFARLSADEKPAVLKHLKKMASGKGWHPEQAVSAQAALDALDKPSADH